MKLCITCGKENKSRLKNECQRCYDKRWKKEHPDRYRTNQNRWRKKVNWRKSDANNLKVRTKYATNPEYKEKMLIRTRTRYYHNKNKKNVCLLCGAQGKTQLHHIEYKVDTYIELCHTCHLKIHGKWFPVFVDEDKKQ